MRTPPDETAVAVANSLIRAIPEVTSIKDEKKAQDQLRLAYSLSRILWGENFPNNFNTRITTASLRF